jgi:hypothetical protein
MRESLDRLLFILQTASVILLAGLALMLASPVSATHSDKAGSSNARSETADSYETAERFVTYKWNLSDQQRPLLNLPDRLNTGVDLSLAYPMGQFGFPLFQSLDYNERADKYLLLLIPKDTRRADLIELRRTSLPRNYAAEDGSAIRLIDNGAAKQISAGDGTEYRFVRFADGELRCKRISNPSGIAIDLSYSGENLIQIADASGRSISFNYSGEQIESITQRWTINSAVASRTWTVAGEKNSARPIETGYFQPALFAVGKAVPNNAMVRTYTKAMAESDELLAGIFGDPGAVAAANGFEPQGLAKQYPWYRGDLISDDGRILRGHLAHAMHLYGNADGTGNSSVYVPSGFTSHSNAPTPTDAAVTFYYPRLGNMTNVTLAVFHVANFLISYEGARVRIGELGGPGGSFALYKHSHLDFYRGNTGLPDASAREALRIDPARVFGSKG